MRRYWWLLLGLWASTLHAANFASRLEQQEKDPKTAVASLSKTIEQSSNAEDWLLLSHGYLSLLNKDGAMTSVNKALELGLSPDLEIAALRHKALVYGLLFRDTPSAVDTLLLAEKHVQYLDHPSKPQLQAAIFESFAQAYNQLGQIPKAVSYADAAIGVAVEHQLASEELQARLIAGRLALQQNNYALAQLHLSEGLRLAQELGRTTSLGSIHLRLGMAYHKLQQYPIALSHFAQAEQLLQMPERRNQLITVLLNKAQTLQQTGELVQAEADLQQAMKFANEINDPTMIAQAYYGQAELALANKNWQQAEVLLSKAQQLYTQIRSVTMATETALAQVELALGQNQPEKAIAYFPKVNDFKSLPLFLQEEFLQKSAKVHALQQQWQQAYQQAELANEVRFQLNSEQQKQLMDPLQNSLSQKKLEKELKRSAQQIKFWQLAASFVAAMLLLIVVWMWRRRQPITMPLHHDWLEFSKKAQAALKNQQQLQLQVWQSAVLTENNIPAVLGLLPEQKLLASCWYQQQLWLLWQEADELILQNETSQRLSALQQLLGSQWRSWQGNMTTLLGANIQPQAVTGLSHLVAHSFHTMPSTTTPLQSIVVRCFQSVPCSWLGENIQADLQNALQLGLIKLTELPLAQRKTA